MKPVDGVPDEVLANIADACVAQVGTLRENNVGHVETWLGTCQQNIVELVQSQLIDKPGNLRLVKNVPIVLLRIV